MVALWQRMLSMRGSSVEETKMKIRIERINGREYVLLGEDGQTAGVVQHPEGQCAYYYLGNTILFAENLRMIADLLDSHTN